MEQTEEGQDKMMDFYTAREPSSYLKPNKILQ